MPELHIDAVVYEEDGLFVAHALQLDLVVTAPSEHEAIDDLLEVCQAQIVYAAENDNFENIFRPAPPEVWQRFFKTKAQAQKRQRETKISRWDSITSGLSLSAVPVMV
ncbi:MAG: hypothetical protein HYZ11_09550 [Candidatus Tectomicrobia bacterium]|uniref:Uncharacterized protein n=1 Tax=Tectimicrobiota bacterium TaxID=2528274 RepID=A0A932I1V2_UNCTE|nr:hypothetical protein [Candidatus Tectomicrobia bacterium]